MLFEKKEKITVNVNGMSCGHCVKRVETALKAIRGVSSVKVSLENKCADVEYAPSKTSPEEFVKAVNALGFEASV